MNPLFAQDLGVFGAGLLTSITPCVYPMIPITVGYLGQNATSTNGRRTAVLGLFTGQVLAFTALGVLAVALGEVIGFSAEVPGVKLATGVVLIIMGLFSLKGELPAFLSKWNNSVFITKTSSAAPRAFGQALVVGAVTALVTSPCAGPVLGGVLALMAQSGSLVTGSFLMFLYSAGLSTLFLLLGLGLLSAKSLPRSGKWLSKVHKISSFLLLGTGAYYLMEWVLSSF